MNATNHDEPADEIVSARDSAAALGRIPNPITRKAHRNLPTARHFIDTLAMLEQKTAGNLTEDERRVLEEIQHQLRMMYMSEQPS